MSTGFGSLGLSPPLLEVMAELGFERPTPVQAAAIPRLLAGKDLVARAETGSGKTVAFALPLLQGLSLEARQLAALVLCPTRELCAQVTRELRRLGRKRAGLSVLALSGGAPIGPQLQALARGVHVVVGTPGRVLDLLRRGRLPLQHVRLLVLDEADRMLDMGFAEDVTAIIAALPAQRQTALFSATFPESVAALSGGCQRDPVRIEIGSSAAQPTTIQQLLYRVEPAQKLPALQRALARFGHDSALVFANQKRSVSEIAAELGRVGLRAGVLHGDLAQHERDQALALFRNRSLRVLVASDLAARGIDVEQLDLVVNFELPTRSDVYLHRIGRTGRAGKPGVALSLVGRAEEARLAAIEAETGCSLAPAELGPTVAPQPTAAARTDCLQTLQIAGGRKQKLRAGDILGALTAQGDGLRGDQVGKIEIHDQFTYVAVAEQACELAYTKLTTGIKGRRFRVRRV